MIKRLVQASNIQEETKWADLSKTQLQNLANQLTNSSFKTALKSLFWWRINQY
jgi:hypothetical protein